MEAIYELSIIVHACTCLYLAISRTGRIEKYKFSQIVETVLLFINIYLMLYCTKVFSELQNYDKTNGDALNPSKFITTGKFLVALLKRSFLMKQLACKRRMKGRSPC